MHRTLKGGGRRAWIEQRDDTLYLNAAEVPRVRKGRRHHVQMTLTTDAVVAEEVWL
jgi:hypothetical protein